MDSVLYNELLLIQQEDENDPFYSETNMKRLRESLEQSKRGETQFF